MFWPSPYYYSKDHFLIETFNSQKNFCNFWISLIIFCIAEFLVNAIHTYAPYIKFCYFQLFNLCSNLPCPHMCFFFINKQKYLLYKKKNKNKMFYVFSMFFMCFSIFYLKYAKMHNVLISRISNAKKNEKKKTRVYKNIQCFVFDMIFVLHLKKKIMEYDFSFYYTGWFDRVCDKV